MNIDRLSYLLAQVNKNALSAEESQELETWYQSVRDDSLYIRLSPEERQLLEDRMLVKIRAGIEKTYPVTTPHKTSLIRSLRSRWYYGAAAVLLLTVLYFTNPWLSRGVEAASLSTHAAERKQLTLPDGTKIWVSPSSTITYPKKITGPTREITLSGEAYFEVARDTLRPFIIHSEALDTRVLGTSFNIQAYQDQADIFVTVVTGQVSVGPGAAAFPAKLSENQRAVFSKERQVVTVEDYPSAAKEMLSRKDGVFEYDGTPVALILEDLKRQFGIETVVEGDISHCTYYGSLRPEDNPQTFLEELSYLIRARLTKTDNGYMIKVKGCN